MRTPITYYGGKQQLASKIISMMPSHRIYCEPFFGGGAVFFQKPKSYLEVINDKNDRLITFYRQAQEHFDELRCLIENTLHSETEYLKAKNFYNGQVPAGGLELAWSGNGVTVPQEAIQVCSCETSGWSLTKPSVRVWPRFRFLAGMLWM